jgi:hypothetical protein
VHSTTLSTFLYLFHPHHLINFFAMVTSTISSTIEVSVLCIFGHVDGIDHANDTSFLFEPSGMCRF